MLGLEIGLRVGQITQFNVIFCGPDQDAGDVLRDPVLADLDQIPVRHKSRVVGVLERGRLPVGTVRQSMRLLDDSLLVSSEEPLTKFVPLLKKNSYRLVLVGTEINGIVTRSDIGKAPVRLLAFTLVSHLETAMTELIREHCSDDQSLFARVGEQRQRKLEGRLKKRRSQNLVLSALELADLSDKRAALHAILKLSPSAVQELKDIEDLRNAVAHARDYAKTDKELSIFIKRMSLAQSWIRRVSKLSGGIA
jgi:hypothetical protein